MQLFTLVFLGLCAVVAVFSVVKSYQFAQRREKIYVLDQGKSLMLALSQDLSQNRPVEAGTSAASTGLLHAGLDRRPSRATSTAPCSYATRAPTTTVQDLQEKGYYNVVAGNINQQVQVDSVVCDQYLSVPRNDLCTADDYTREQRYERSLITRCNSSTGALGQQPAGFLQWSASSCRKPRSAGHSTINYDTEWIKRAGERIEDRLRRVWAISP